MVISRNTLFWGITRNRFGGVLRLCYVCATMARTNPIGVRFDPDKLDFIKKREKLESNQQVVDLLINRYWWEHKIPVPTHKESPPLDLKQATIQSTQQEIKQPLKPRKTPEQWVAEKREILDNEGYQVWFKELQSDPYLSDKQKSIIKQA